MFFLYLSLALIFLLVFALLLSNKGTEIKKFFQFYITGLDSGFSLSQIRVLAKVGELAGLEDRSTLFWSVAALDRCTAEIVRQSRVEGTENDPKVQKLLSALYTYRTQIDIEQTRKKRGVETTRAILIGQKVRILLRGVGIFSSTVTGNTSKFLRLDFPSHPKIQATSIEWTNRIVTVYFWRKDDAGYEFETTIISDPEYEEKAVILLAHTSNLTRTQMRNTIRVKCHIHAQMYLLKPGDETRSLMESEPGMKCLLEDISEDGAMVMIGGKAVKGLKIKLQFMINDVLIVMPGEIRGVEFDQEKNQSRIHLQSEKLNPRMRNAILSFVYNVLPEEKKEELDAIRLTEEDALAEANLAGNVPPDASAGTQEKAGASKDELPDFAEKLV
ncbi:PilZ domain-containing protein [Brucepastera parasyntrophica]|uniref:flagellar brake protein n=1 Tax=Brucepastera parasyntrophica TaxID=2880008 RepID=UPI00210B6EDB|nr:PilZ domain-containing protein [Brucepastera parasyntrophica]ULQ60068.1 PilZ domain-containing protein [Brucepastera parasyntrophica]